MLGSLWLTTVFLITDADGRTEESRAGSTTGFLHRLQRAAQRGGQDRVLPARRQLKQSHDSGRLAAGDGLAGGAGRAAWKSAVYLYRSSVWDQI